MTQAYQGPGFYNRELVPPSVMDECVCGHVTSLESENFILVRGRLLEIYILREIRSKHDNLLKGFLELQFRESLFGDIESIGLIRRQGNLLDSILLSFQTAKVNAICFIILLFIQKKFSFL
jgi:hypothetical protein